MDSSSSTGPSPLYSSRSSIETVAVSFAQSLVLYGAITAGSPFVTKPRKVISCAQQVIAIDNSEKMVEFGASLAREHGFGNLEYRLGDIEAPPIDDASVDLALFSQALHHAPSPHKAVKSAHRILRPGGRIMILDLASHSYEQARELYAHVWLGFSEAGLYQMLTEAGFSQVEVSIVAREKQAPHFQTLLATGTKS